MGGALARTDIIQGQKGRKGRPEVRYRAHVAFASAAELLDNLSKVHNRRRSAHLREQRVRLNHPFEKSRTGQAEFFENRRTQMNPSSSNTTTDTARMPGRRIRGPTSTTLRDRGRSSPTRTWCGAGGVDASREPRECGPSTPSIRAAWWACRP